VHLFLRGVYHVVPVGLDDGTSYGVITADFGVGLHWE